MARVSQRIHDDEPDTSEATVRALLARQCPQWATRPLTYLATSGTDNAMWRVHAADGDDVVVRLPRRPGAAANVALEVDVLQRLVTSTLATVVRTPRVLHAGHADDVFPFRWAVLDWLDGDDAWALRTPLGDDLDRLATDVAGVVRAIGVVAGMPVAARRPGERGGPIAPILDDLDGWLGNPRWGAAELIDVPAVRRVMADASERIGGEPVPLRFVHGDLIPGNLLVDGGRLAAVIDWGSAGTGDPAQDLAPAWSVFSARSRRVFREAVGTDESTWQRARLFELQHAVAGVLYYVPRRHTLGDVMARTLHRLLTDE